MALGLGMDLGEAVVVAARLFRIIWEGRVHACTAIQTMLSVSDTCGLGRVGSIHCRTVHYGEVEFTWLGYFILHLLFAAYSAVMPEARLLRLPPILPDGVHDNFD